MKWCKLSEETIQEILYSKFSYSNKEKDGTQNIMYPNKDGYIMLSFICDEPLVMYKLDLDDIQYWVSIDEVVDSVSNING